MMRDTPRTFVGSVVFLLQAPVTANVAEAVHAEIGRLPGISRCDLDVASGALLITADVPTDRTDILAALDRLGCRVQA